MTEHDVAVLLEEVRSQFKIFGEALQGNREEHQRTRLELGGKIDGLDTRLIRVEGRLEGVEGRLEGVEGRLEGVEGRLEGVEGRLELVEHRLELNGVPVIKKPVKRKRRS